MDMTCQLLVHFINLSFESFMIVCLWKLSHWSLVIHLLSVIDDNKKMIYQERVYRSCECTLFFQPKQHHRSKRRQGGSIINEREVGVGFVCLLFLGGFLQKKRKKWLQSLSHASFVRKIDSSMYKFVFGSLKLVLSCMYVTFYGFTV